MSSRRSGTEHDSSRPLVCPSCATTHPLEDRFCERCGMPLVYAGRLGVDDPVTDAHERARKIKPQYAEGELVRVVGARNLTEAEFLQGLLLEEGVPSVLRRARGFDVPDFLAAGPRDVLVPASGAPAAHEVLLQSDLAPGPLPPLPAMRVAIGLLAGFGAVALIAWLLSQSV